MNKLLLPLFLLFSISVSAQNFEGIIEFKKQEGTVTENSVWYIKDDKVRIDYFEPGSRVLSGCVLINMKDSTKEYLDHKAKTITVLPIGDAGKKAGSTAETTRNSKEILTYKTTETVLKTGGDSTYSYWINTGKFGFFNTALYVLGPQNSYFENYWALDPKENSMPLLVQKKNASGTETGRLEAIRIEKRTIDANLFNIPTDYKRAN